MYYTNFNLKWLNQILSDKAIILSTKNFYVSRTYQHTEYQDQKHYKVQCILKLLSYISTLTKHAHDDTLSLCFVMLPGCLITLETKVHAQILFDNKTWYINIQYFKGCNLMWKNQHSPVRLASSQIELREPKLTCI